MFSDSAHDAEPRRKRNPSESANMFSRITFFFTYGLIWNGLKKEIVQDDLYETVRLYRSNKLGDLLENEWREEQRNKSPSLIRALWRIFGRIYILYGVTQLIFKIPTMLMLIYAVYRLVQFFEKGVTMTFDEKKENMTEAYAWGSIIILTIFVRTLYTHIYMFSLQRLALKIRVCICSLLYRKCLNLSSFSVEAITTGKIITLMSKDVREFENLVISIQEAWVGVIHVLLMTAMLYVYIGPFAGIGIAVLILFTVMQLLISNVTTRVRLKTASKTDKRLKLIQEVLSSIQMVKMYTWEDYFSKTADECRKKEIRMMRIVFYLKSLILHLGDISIKLAFFICMLVYTTKSDEVSAANMQLTSLCFLNMKSVISTDIPLLLSTLAEMRSSIRRIQEVLMAKEVNTVGGDSIITVKEPSITLENICIKLVGKSILEGVSVEIEKALIGMVGSVGSGKTTLFKLILNDLPEYKGKRRINGSVSYAPQEPWLFPGTIKQNILFGQKYVKDRYEKVINVCALKSDLDILPNGDNTVINDKGVCLSRGQQERISLARAVYRNADIYLLDNALSSLDVDVSRHIFYKCIKGHLCDKLCILVTNRIEFLEKMEKILLIKDGKIEIVNVHQSLDLQDKCWSLENLSDLSLVDNRAEHIDDTGIYANATETTKFLEKSMIDYEGLYHESKRTGKVDYGVYNTYFKLSGYIFLCLLIFGYVAYQAGMVAYQKFILRWIDIEHNLTIIKYNVTNANQLQAILAKRQGIPKLFICILGFMTFAAGIIYFMLYQVSTKVSTRLHKMVFRRIIKAKMEFFDGKLLGNILNRFSKDIATIDEYIPSILRLILQNIFQYLGVLVLFATLNGYVFFLTIGIGVLGTVLRRIYLPTCRSLKRLDGVTRSPVIGHLKSSLDGVTIIRSGGLQDILRKQFDKCQDLHTSADYMYMTCDRSLGFSIDILCTLYGSSIILGFLFLYQSVTVGKISIIISNALMLTKNLPWTIRQWAELENQMTSVERVLEYVAADVEDENGLDFEKWPKEGSITYENVCLRYPRTNQPVLKNVSFTIKPGERICIIGRTGAGKTSLISTLFRLYQIESGKIVIDGVDTGVLKLKCLRSRISIIPQSPTLFSGTFRSNLDPYQKFSDAELWTALREMNMKNYASGLPYTLYTNVQEGGSNFSAGQRQLICLTRSLLSKSKILILDEVTSEVDLDTMDMVDLIVRSKFSDCTVLTIIHRLGSVMNFDKVMIVADGRIKEFGDPKELLGNEDNIFYKMMAQEGLIKRIKR